MGGGSGAAMLLLRALPAAACRHCSPKPALRSHRSYAVKASLDPPDVQRLAETARLSLTPQQVEEFGPKIQKVVEWFGQLQAVDLQSIEPAIRADTEDDHLRDDVPDVFSNRASMIAAVPTYEDSYIKVPKVLNKES